MQIRPHRRHYRPNRGPLDPAPLHGLAYYGIAYYGIYVCQDRSGDHFKVVSFHKHSIVTDPRLCRGMSPTSHWTVPNSSTRHLLHPRADCNVEEGPGKTTEGVRVRTSITRPSDRRMPPTKTSHTQCVSRTYTLGQDVRVIIEANPSARERGERTRPSGRRMPRVTTTMTTTTKGRPRPLPARRRGRRQCLNI